MIANRNGYVNVCLEQRRRMERFKSRWIDKIRVLDSRVFSEIKLYEDEYNAVLEAVKIFNKKVTNNF